MVLELLIYAKSAIKKNSTNQKPSLEVTWPQLTKDSHQHWKHYITNEYLRDNNFWNYFQQKAKFLSHVQQLNIPRQ